MRPPTSLLAHLGRDFTASIAVFLVALPLCLGISLASQGKDVPGLQVPLMAGVLAGIIGGIVVGLLSGSHTSVSGPAAGLTAVVSAQMAAFGSFDVFLVALLIAGIIQIVLGLLKAGFIAEFFPSSVIKGLLTAIGIILILKQVPHLVGHDPDPDGEMSFFQPDQRNTFTEIIDTITDLQPGATLVGFISLLGLIFWDKIAFLKKLIIPSALVIVVIGVALYHLLKQFGNPWIIEPSHLVQIPIPKDWNESFQSLLQFPNFSVLADVSKWGLVLKGAFTLAIVASLETLLNVEAVDKIDPLQRNSPGSRELNAQGVGNFLAGLLGAIPVTSVIVRSTVNINAGARTKLSAILHGIHMLVFVLFFPTLLNMIPLSCLAAILIMTGFKLAHPKNFISMWKQGWFQFLPFIVTVVAIVFTDLLVGILIGLVVSIGFILRSNLRRPLTKVMEKHASGEVLHIRLANQVSFLNKAVLSHLIDDLPDIRHILIDARDTDFIDPDILELIHSLKNDVGPANNIQISLLGFQDKYNLQDEIQFIDYTSQELREQLTPDLVLQILKEGNERFLNGKRLSRDLHRQIAQTSTNQFPMAAVLSCMDSRAPTELVFDVGLGDLFIIRIAGNVAREKVLGSLEYACQIAGSKLIVVMGHTGCGAVTAAVDLMLSGKSARDFTSCDHLELLLGEIGHSVDQDVVARASQWTPEERKSYINDVARRHVIRTVRMLTEQSSNLSSLLAKGQIKIVGAMYNLQTGKVEFLEPSPS